MLEAIKKAYEIFESLNISMTGLLVIAAILALAFLFAVREAASWFLKVDDLKKDLRRLRETTVQLEAEIRTLQNLMAQSKQASLNLVGPVDLEAAPLAAGNDTPKEAKAPATQFTISR